MASSRDYDVIVFEESYYIKPNIELIRNLPKTKWEMKKYFFEREKTFKEMRWEDKVEINRRFQIFHNEQEKFARGIEESFKSLHEWFINR